MKHTAARALTVAAALWAVSPVLAPTPSAQDTPTPSVQDASTLGGCATDQTLLTDHSTLPQSRQALAARRLRILAVGSSSTLGVGLSARGQPWPALLGGDLRARFPDARIDIVNRGLERQTAQMMLARMGAEIEAAHPDLVIWEVGTFEAVRGSDVAQFRETLLAGVAKIKHAGADLLIVDPQYTRMHDVLFNAEPYVRMIGQVASEADLVVFRRNEVMRDWAASGYLAPRTDRAAKAALADAVHACWARLIAGLIASTINP